MSLTGGFVRDINLPGWAEQSFWGYDPLLELDWVALWRDEDRTDAHRIERSVLLDATPDLVESLPGELDDVECVQHGCGLAQLVAQCVGVAAERVQGGDLDAVTKPGAAVLEPGREHGPERPGTRSSSRACTFPSSSRVRSTIPVSIVGPLLAALCGVWCHTCSSTPSVATPVRRDSSAASSTSRGRTARHTVFQVVPSCRARPWIVACSCRS